MTLGADNWGRGRRRRATALELGLLAVGLAALGAGAGALGWTIGRGSTRTVTVAGPATATAASTTAAVRGDPAAGKAVFVSSGCGSCHVLAATGAKGTVGPNLDQVKLTESQIEDWVGKGKGAMPSFKAQLSAKQIADVSAFLAQAEK